MCDWHEGATAAADGEVGARHLHDRTPGAAGGAPARLRPTLRPRGYRDERTIRVDGASASGHLTGADGVPRVGRGGSRVGQYVVRGLSLRRDALLRQDGSRDVHAGRRSAPTGASAGRGQGVRTGEQRRAIGFGDGPGGARRATASRGSDRHDADGLGCARLGQHRFRRLPLPGYALLREHQGGHLHD